MIFLFEILSISAVLADYSRSRNEFATMGNPNGHITDIGTMAESSIEIADYACLEFYNSRHESDEGTGVSKLGEGGQGQSFPDTRIFFVLD